MKYVAVVIAIIAVIAILFVTAGARGATTQRTGLIAVFAVTRHEINDGRMRLVVKQIRDRKSRPIGMIGQVCTRLPTAPAEWSCVGTIDMPLGHITYQGMRRSARYYVLAVTGGTGVYAGSRGSMAARTITTGPRVEWLLVSLV